MGRGILPNTVKDMAKYKGAEKGAHTQGGGSRKMRFHFFAFNVVIKTIVEEGLGIMVYR